MVNFKALSKDIWTITKKTAAAWFEADPFRQSAIIAYYAIFSIPALLVIIISCAGFAFGQEAVRGEITSQISNVMGHDTALQVEEMIIKASAQKGSIWATIISIITLILGATGVFTQLQVSLNQIWEVKVVAKKVWLKSVKDRLFSFGLIISIAFLLLISLLVTAAVAAFSGWIKAYLPEFILVVFYLINFIISFGVISVLFALMFKILPDAIIKWGDVWIGSFVTGFFFVVGKFALEIYFGKAEPASTYGAAGSIILIMLWVSYSCMIVFFGAEFTKQYAVHFGHEIVPTKDAQLIVESPEKALISDKLEATEKIEKPTTSGRKW
ncbi:MAG: YihY/virulence factor BrkB family protein [Bacteroidia bacterium]|nr:YihY/virulence factor BrkB family protein [Bacteroidia bacterium]